MKLFLLPEPLLLLVPAPIPSSHSRTEWNQKAFFVAKIRFGNSDTFMNANLGALVDSGALSHKRVNININKIVKVVYNNHRRQKVFETQIAGGVTVGRQLSAGGSFVY